MGIILYKLKRSERYKNDSLRWGYISASTALDHQINCKSRTVSQPEVNETLVPNENITHPSTSTTAIFFKNTRWRALLLPQQKRCDTLVAVLANQTKHGDPLRVIGR